MSPPSDIQERTFEFSVQIIRFCQSWHKPHAVTWLITKQLLSAATSVGANMEEADGAQTKPDFKTKIATARKEAKGVVYWLRLIAATDEVARPRVGRLLDEANQIASIVTAIRRDAESNDNRGE